MDDDTEQACWAQQEQDERRQREDEAIAHCRPLAEEFTRECAQFQRDTLDFWKRISVTR